MIKYFTLFCFVILFCIEGISQDLTYSNLIFLQTKDLEYINNYMNKKGWEFNSSEVDDTSSFSNYSTVSWSLNKNEYDDKARGWFYLYQNSGSENALVYQTLKNNFNKIKKTVLNSGFKLDGTEAMNDGIKSRYRNKKLEFVFTTKKYSDNDYSYDEDIHYTITLFNFKEIEEQIKLQQELELQRLLEEIEQERLDSIRDAKYQTLISSADNLFKQKSYSKAKQTYQEALTVKDEYYPTNKISEITKILNFLNERQSKVYEYKQLNSSEYYSVEKLLIADIKEVISKKKYTGKSEIRIIYNVDTLGKTKVKFSEINVTNPDMAKDIKIVSKTIQLKPVYKNEYTVNAKAEYRINISIETDILSAKKNNVETLITNGNSSKYKNEVDKVLSNTPMGKYTISIQKRDINNSDFSDNKIIKYKNIGGPSNMFLSILVPGLGVKNVTGGSQSGLSRTLWTYGLIASGIGCKAYSISEYDKYHKATTQTEMDTHYDNANSYNYFFYALTGAGVVYWIYDIVWVANKGFQNVKNQKNFKNNLGVYYNPNTKGLMMSYKINF